ncbi:hypothetical protein SHKM778_07510 [Streptomyces sp. KM77-8]|uniref:Uncharacterized protein n=1 Tax=Streptomyces haneummycinicus TaxID=3074435 RepID=A0AAT9HAF3_9ACTN
MDGRLYGDLARALPEAVLQWAPAACPLLCLVPLGLLLTRLTWPVRWGVLYVAGWPPGCSHRNSPRSARPC